jgi:hypothetical protein
MESDSEKRSKFMTIYARTPDSLRDDILVVVNDRPFTWDSAFLEVKNDTELGKKILNIIKEIGII